MAPQTLVPDIEAFLQLKTRQELADWLGISDKRLRFLLYRLPEESRYLVFSVKKRGGGDRSISAPIAPLKAIQRRLLEAFEQLISVNPIANGFVKGRSIVDHARPHKRRRHVLTVDLKEFFPSINFGRVRNALLSKPFNLNRDVANIIAQVVCLKGVLPQGAPTSPILSNLICYQLDAKLLALAKRLKCAVTRYADDICFSTNFREFPPELAVADSPFSKVGAELNRVITEAGFCVNDEKTRLRSDHDRKMVVGLVVNRSVAMPRSWRRQLRMIAHLRRKFGAEKATEIVSAWPEQRNRTSPYASVDAVIRGKAGFAHWLDRVTERNKSAGGFSKAMFRNFPSIRRLLPKYQPDFTVRVMTEGQSDPVHFESALSFFHSNNEFLDLALRFANHQTDLGDADLWESIKRIAGSVVGELTIALFDCDNHRLLRQMGIEPGGYRSIGTGVYIATLVSPSWARMDRYCIESLYNRGELCRLETNGRRVFFRDEFDDEGLHTSGDYQLEFPMSRREIVVSGRVFRRSDMISVNLGKVELANQIRAANEPFAAMNFEGFRPTMQLIRKIVEERGTRAS